MKYYIKRSDGAVFAFNGQSLEQVQANMLISNLSYVTMTESEYKAFVADEWPKR